MLKNKQTQSISAISFFGLVGFTFFYLICSNEDPQIQPTHSTSFNTSEPLSSTSLSDNSFSESSSTQNNTILSSSMSSQAVVASSSSNIPINTDYDAPEILSGPTLSEITVSSAQITFQTNEPAGCQIEYKDENFYITSGTRIPAQRPSVNEYTSIHHFDLTGLTADTLYYYYLICTDEAYNQVLFDIETFSTLTTDYRLGWIGSGGTACAPTPCFKTDGVGDGGCASNGLREPNGLAVDDHGNMYITDFYWNRVQKYQSSGFFLGWIGLYDTGLDCNDNNGSLSNYWSTDYYASTFVANEVGAIINPTDIAVNNAQGCFYISLSSSNRIPRWSLSGHIDTVNGCFLGGDTAGWHCITTTPSGNTITRFNQPKGLGIDDSYLYVADTGNHRITRFNHTDGAFNGCIGGGVQMWNTDTGTCEAIISGTGDVYFNSPQDVSFDNTGNMYIVDTNNHRIQKWTTAGTYVGWIGQGYTTGICTGTAPMADSIDGAFDSPTKLALDEDANLYIVDTNNHRIQKWESNGTYVGWLGKNHYSFQSGDTPTSSGTSLGELDTPKGITYDPVNRRLYVSDSNNYRIQAFQLD